MLIMSWRKFGRRDWIESRKTTLCSHWITANLWPAESLPGLKPERPFSVRMRVLHGGRQEGVSIADIDTGAMRISVIPTRGMNVLEAVCGDVRIGWRSPVSEVVNPAFIELNGRRGLGWLEGFNEMVTRCGYEWVGHPGMDKGVMLPLHGLAANIPASRVVLSIDEKPPYTIRLKGDLKEQAFKSVNFVIATVLTFNSCPSSRSGRTPIHSLRGYVTGLEAGTSFAYNRSYQRALNRVPTIRPKEQMPLN